MTTCRTLTCVALKMIKSLAIKSKFSFETVALGTFFDSIFSMIQPIIEKRFIWSNMQRFSKTTANNIKTSFFNDVQQGSSNHFSISAHSSLSWMSRNSFRGSGPWIPDVKHRFKISRIMKNPIVIAPDKVFSLNLRYQKCSATVPAIIFWQLKISNIFIVFKLTNYFRIIYQRCFCWWQNSVAGDMSTKLCHHFLDCRPQ